MKIGLLLCGLLLFFSCLAQQPEPPGLFFREDWNELPPYDVMTPYSLSQADVLNPELVLRLYGAGQDSLKKRHHGTSRDAYYVFSGFCPQTWALTLTKKTYYANLTGNAAVRLRMMNSGFRELHLILKLADGTWLIGDKSEGSSSAWQIHDFIIRDIKWYQFDAHSITEGNIMVENPDLGLVEEIGFTDLMNGGRSAACSRVDWIEVYAEDVKIR